MNLDTGTDQLVASYAAGVAELVLNNPARRNAFSRDMLTHLPAVVDELTGRWSARVLVISGAGGKAFASGADVSELQPAGDPAMASYESLYRDALRHIRELAIPVIAMIDGYCLGGGMQLALTADVRYATPRSTFGIPAARIGLGYRETEPLAILIGTANAAEMLFTARHYPAADAARIGLVNQLFEVGQLRTEVVGHIAAQIAANAPLSIRAAKLSLRELSKPAGERDHEAVRRAVDDCVRSQDLLEGRQAFRERREPRFTGRLPDDAPGSRGKNALNDAVLAAYGS
jgi:enoyl-CoA hydratase